MDSINSEAVNGNNPSASKQSIYLRKEVSGRRR